ncbi:hypothetical protein [Dongshaea marina]|uniref:hypothetical protein n=1 Tax=Dongshaea marina TaxID=2047966 RepID=UPI000D3E9C69|nr:hypothetical protein [Dongshaea marina]
MVRLTRKGWNNVLIFAVMAIILLFQLADRRIQRNAPAEQILSLLPKDAVILTWKGPDYSIERIGNSWRVQPALKISSLQISSRLDYWLHQQWPKSPNQQFPEQGEVIRVWLAGHDQPLLLTLSRFQGDYYVRNWLGVWLQVTSEDYWKLKELVVEKNA